MVTSRSRALLFLQYHQRTVLLPTPIHCKSPTSDPRLRYWDSACHVPLSFCSRVTSGLPLNAHYLDDYDPYHAVLCCLPHYLPIADVRALPDERGTACEHHISHHAGALRAEQVVKGVLHKKVAACRSPPIGAFPRHPVPLVDELQVVPSCVVWVQDLHMQCNSLS